MESIRELYRIGHGPSSSHTMGPRNAAQHFFTIAPDAKAYDIALYGSLASTGKGHLTDTAMREVFASHDKAVEISWHPDEENLVHPNTLVISTSDGSISQAYYSVGGGKIVLDGEKEDPANHPYPTQLTKMREILSFCDAEGMQLWEFVLHFEGEELMEYMDEVWTAMEEALQRGLHAEGVLPGGLKLARKASQYYVKARTMEGGALPLCYALAVSEENAAGNKIVTAPTCGACGVLPGVLYYFATHEEMPRIKILRALLTAGLIGTLVKANGSISGAEVGCQGEVGVACAMAGAAATQLWGGTIYQVEYAAEMGLEHHLGLTCDPIMGLVQIPCIERNALGAMRSLDHATYALLGDGRHKVSFDSVVAVMMETGQALPSLYRETSKGGLARVRES